MTERLKYTWENGQLIVKIEHEPVDMAILRRLVRSMEGRQLTIPREGLTLRVKFYWMNTRIFESNQTAEFVISGAGQIISVKIDGLVVGFEFNEADERQLSFKSNSAYKLIIDDDLMGHIQANELNIYHMQFY
jgi:hypothetical protein